MSVNGIMAIVVAVLLLCITAFPNDVWRHSKIAWSALELGRFVAVIGLARVLFALLVVMEV